MEGYDLGRVRSFSGLQISEIKASCRVEDNTPLSVLCWYILINGVRVRGVVETFYKI